VNERKKIYDELSRILTDYESNEVGEEELYNILVDIQNSWETIITKQD